MRRLTITDGQILGSFSNNLGNGGGIANQGIVILDDNDSQVTGNGATVGGGIYKFSGGPVMLNNAAISHNTPDNCEPPGGVAGCSS